MSTVDEIQAIKLSDLSDVEKKKQIRKLRRQAKTQVLHPPVDLDIIEKILEAAEELPFFDNSKESGYAFSLKAASKIPGADWDAVKRTFRKRFGYLPSKHSVIKLSWDTLLILGPVNSTNVL